MDPVVVTSRSGRAQTFTCRSMNAQPTTFCEQHLLCDLPSTITHNSYSHNASVFKLRGAKARLGALRLPRQHLYDDHFISNPPPPSRLTQEQHRPLTNGRRSIPPHHKPHTLQRTPHDLLHRLLRHSSLPRRRTPRPTHPLRPEIPQHNILVLQTPSA